MKKQKLDYILADLEPIFTETNEGLARLVSIVKALKVFSRVDQEGKLEEYNLNEGVKNSLIVAKNEIKYVATIQTELNEVPIIQAIGSQVNQVILNILVNAAHAIAANNPNDLGVITVKTYEDAEFICCSIEDTGTGIPQEIIKDIFNPFFTTKPAGKGTGLGLSISYDIIVNKHHGVLVVESEVGKGSRFIIKLPCFQQE